MSTIIDGKFELLRLLGEGGMGAVYEARNIRSGKRVALKRMSNALGGMGNATQRFVREAQAATAIEHPGVVEVYDVGVAEGTPYIVMELLQGEPLTSLMERETRVAPRRFVALLGRALGALAAAHAKGIVHRDLKPDNVFLARVPGTGEPAPKLLDFGISKLRAEAGELGLTKTGVVMGTPVYMSPEQAEGLKSVDARADIYSLGVIFYQALAGQLPFHADSLSGLMVAIFTKTPAPLATVAPDVPPAVSGVVMRAIARAPSERYGSVAEFVGALAHALGDPSVITEAALPLPASSSAAAPDLASTVVGTPAQRPWLVPTPTPAPDATRTAGSTAVALPPASALAVPTPFVSVSAVPPASSAPRPRAAVWAAGLFGLGVAGALAATAVVRTRSDDHARPAPVHEARVPVSVSTPPAVGSAPVAPQPEAAPDVPVAAVAPSAPEIPVAPVAPQLEPAVPTAQTVDPVVPVAPRVRVGPTYPRRDRGAAPLAPPSGALTGLVAPAPRPVSPSPVPTPAPAPAQRPPETYHRSGTLDPSEF